MKYSVEYIINTFRAGFWSLEEANEHLAVSGYVLRDTYVRGEYHLYPLESGNS